MAVLTIINTAATDSLVLPANTWTSLVGGAITVTGLGGLVAVQGYIYNVDFSQVEMRIVVDGVDVVESATPQISINVPLSIGLHTIDLQAISLNQNSAATTRGLLAFTL